MSACGDSGSKKWRLDNKELTQDELAKLKFAIVFKEKIEKENCWGDLSGENWVGLLFYFPEESKRCSQFNGWNKLGGSDWANLLSGETRFEKECDKFSGWKMMSNENWIELLSAQPKYMQKATEYKVWETFSNKDWIYAVKLKKNDLIKKCDDLNGWEKFTNKDWKDIIKSKDSELLKKCDKANGWKKLDIKDWEELLLNDISLSSNADKYDVLKSFSLSVWKNLITKNEKFIDIAKNKKILDSIDNATWIDLIISNPKLLSIAKEKEILKKFTPTDWSNLISANPEYINLMKKEASLDKLPNKELIRLYCLQPKLRNDIFSLNKIDVDVAKTVERIYKRFGENGSDLSPKELIVVVKIFPELKKQITEKTFESYNINSWCDILVGDKDIYEIISKKCAYLIPWKKFTFSDWVEILDKRDVLFESFKRYIDVKKLSYGQIRQALDKASISNISTFEKYNFWKDFTKAQYIPLIKDEMGMMLGLQALAGAMSGKRIRNIDNFKSAINSIENIEKNIAEKLIFEGDIEGANNELKSMTDNIKDGKNYDRSYIIKMARDNGIFKQFSDADWKDLCKYDYERYNWDRKYHANEEDVKKAKEVSKEYFLLHEKDSDCSKYIPELLTYENIKEYNLWKKLSQKQYINLDLQVEHHEDDYVKKTKNQYIGFFNAINENNLFDSFDNNTKGSLLRKVSPFISEQGFGDITIWTSKIPVEIWVDIFSEGYRSYNNLCKYCDFSKMKSSDFVRIIKSYYERYKSDKENNRPITNRVHKGIAEIVKSFDLNKFDKKELLEVLKYDIYLAKLNSKGYYNTLSEFTAKDWIELRLHLEKLGDKGVLFALESAFKKMASLSSFSDSDKKELESKGFKMEFASQSNSSSHNIRPIPKAKRTLQPSEKDDTDRAVDFETFKKRESLNRKNILGF